MKLKMREHIKSILIIMLVFMSMIQVGILWNDKSHGFPTGFFMAVFGEEKVPVTHTVASEKLFVPYRMVLSSGDDYHWIIAPGSPDYNYFWRLGRDSIKKIVSGEYRKIESNTEWKEVTTRMGVTFAFRTEITPELLSWYLGISEKEREIPSLLKFKIVPDMSRSGSAELYVYSGRGKPLKYEAGGLLKDTDILKKVENYIYNNVERERQRTYITIEDSKQAERAGMEPDVLYITHGPQLWEYKNVSAKIPEKLQNASKNTELISNIVLGADKGRFIAVTYEEGTIQFNDANNIYKIFPDGVYEYNYLQSTGETDKGSIGEALLNAYRFIDRNYPLLHNTENIDLVITDINKSQNGYYTFRFDYYMDGVPLHINIKSAGAGDPVTSAIVINANEKRVLKCRWLMREFSYKGSGLYQDKFMQVMMDVPKDETKIIRNISIGYVIDNLSDKAVTPSLIIEKTEKDAPGDSVEIETILLPELTED